MIDTPTAPDNKPSNLRDILKRVQFYGLELDEAVAAIMALIPKKRTIDNDHEYTDNTFNKGFNAAIKTTLRNFSGQTEGEGE